MEDHQNNPFLSQAESLMLRHVWQVSDKEFYFTEIEFYSKSVNGGGDPYTHGHVEQLKSDTWYFHGSGIDITFGDAETYGGILIRGVKYKDANNEWQYISGPIRVATAIFSAIGQAKLQQLSFGLKKLTKSLKNEIYACPRVGLNANLDSDYASERYRFITDICPEHKFAQKEKVAMALLKREDLSVDKINELFSYKIIKG